MRRKQVFHWQGKPARSISELVNEDGVLRSELVLTLMERICGLVEEGGQAGRIILHPDCVIVNEYGDVGLEEQELAASAREVYLPPELDRTDAMTPRGKVYGLGKLMLYMVTGQNKKAEAEIALDNNTLLPLIERCTAFDPEKRYENVRQLHEIIKREKRSGRKLLRAVLAGLFVVLLAGGLYMSWQTGMTRGLETGNNDRYGVGYEKGFDQGFSNAPGIGMTVAPMSEHRGNLSGNYAAETGPKVACSEKEVFFLLDGDLYTMDARTGQTGFLRSAPGAYDLQYYDGAIYLCTPEHILRIDPETAKEEKLCDSNSGRLYIFDDTFFLYDSAGTNYLYRINPDRKSLTQLSGAAKYRCLNIAEGSVYYIDPERGSGICCSNTDGGNSTLISSGVYESFCIWDGRLYAETAAGLIRMDLNGGNPELLTTLPASSPNACDGGVFYISGRGRRLEWLSSDGGIRYTVIPTRTASFQVAGQWVFYENEDDGGRLWRARISGADQERAVQ